MRKVQLVEAPQSYAHDMSLTQSMEQQSTLTEAERTLAQVTGGEFWGMPWMMPWMWGMMPWMYGMGYGMGYGYGYGGAGGFGGFPWW